MRGWPPAFDLGANPSPSAMAITFTNIDRPHEYGHEATVGNRQAIVLRVSTDPVLWHCFCYEGGKAIRKPSGNGDVPKSEAMAQAELFLKGGNVTIVNPFVKARKV